MKQELLKKLIEKDKPFPAPVKTTRQGEHYEFLVGIGKDETASVVMTKEGYEALMGVEVDTGQTS